MSITFSDCTEFTSAHLKFALKKSRKLRQSQFHMAWEEKCTLEETNYSSDQSNPARQ